MGVIKWIQQNDYVYFVGVGCFGSIYGGFTRDCSTKAKIQRIELKVRKEQVNIPPLVKVSLPGGLVVYCWFLAAANK
jgi:hypothetical protein